MARTATLSGGRARRTKLSRRPTWRRVSGVHLLERTAGERHRSGHRYDPGPLHRRSASTTLGTLTTGSSAKTAFTRKRRPIGLSKPTAQASCSSSKHPTNSGRRRRSVGCTKSAQRPASVASIESRFRKKAASRRSSTSVEATPHCCTLRGRCGEPDAITGSVPSSWKTSAAQRPGVAGGSPPARAPLGPRHDRAVEERARPAGRAEPSDWWLIPGRSPRACGSGRPRGGDRSGR